MPDRAHQRASPTQSFVGQHTGAQLYDLQEALNRFEHGYIRNILELAQWDMVQASAMSGIRRATLEKKVKVYELWQ